MRDAAVIVIVSEEVFYPPPIQCEPVEYQFCHTARKIRNIIDISAVRLLATELQEIKTIFVPDG